MQAPHDVSRWPSAQGGVWLDPADPDVGSADFGSNSLWDVRILLQVRVRDGVIADARCTYEDRDSQGLEEVIAAAIAHHLVGKATNAAHDVSRPKAPPLRAAWSREEAVRTGELGPTSHPADLMWHAGFVSDAVRAALADWASKASGRDGFLPPPPAPPPRPSLLRRLLRRSAFLRGLGV